MLVICCGMLRSGSTLQYNLVRSIVDASGSGRGEGFWRAELVARGMPRQWADWSLDSSIHVVKSHIVPADALDPGRATGSVKICYIHRDLRPVAASLRRIWSTPWEEILEELDVAVAHFSKISSADNVYVQRYDAVVADLGVAVAELCTFLGIDLAAETQRMIADEWSEANARSRIEKLRVRQPFIITLAKRLPLSRPLRIAGRKMVRRLGLRPVYDPESLLHPNHISAGAAVTLPQLTGGEETAIRERYDDWFRAAGYD